MAVSADFSSRLTAAVAHAPASSDLDDFVSDVGAVATAISVLVPQSPNTAIQIDFENRLIRLAEAVANELRIRN